MKNPLPVHKKVTKSPPFTFKALTHLYVLDSSHNKIRHRLDLEIKEINIPEGQLSPEEKLMQILQLKVKVEEFVEKVALELYDCRHMKSEILNKIKQSCLSDTRGFLESQEVYRKRAINKVIKILNEDLEHNPKKWGDYILYPARSSKQKQSEAVKDHDDHALSEIYNLYVEYFPALKPRKIIASMAIIISATDFWENNIDMEARIRLYFERLKKKNFPSFEQVRVKDALQDVGTKGALTSETPLDEGNEGKD